MKILYDSQIFCKQTYGGISRYFAEVMRVFLENGTPEVHFKTRSTRNFYLTQSPAFAEAVVHSSRLRWMHLFRLGLRLRFGQALAMKLGSEGYVDSAWLLMRGRFDLFHPTYYRPHFLNLLGNKPFVLTVYDMIHERASDEFPSYKNCDIEDKALLAHRANHIIAISESTRKDLLSIHDLAPEKVSVIHLSTSMTPGIGHRLRDRLPDGLPETYVLFVGDRQAYKNFGRFLSALAPLLRADSHLHLVCAGGSQWKQEEMQLLDTLGVRGQCRLYPLVDDDLLAAFYAHALCFVFPSMYEGFGIPLLEAFSQGCPVLASRATSLPELAGDAACYFDPRDEASMHEAISGVIRNGEFRQVLADRGMRQLQRFSWEKTAEKHLEVYERVLKERRFG